MVQNVEHFVEVTPPLTWRATYNDGTVLSQYNPDGSKNSYNNLDREGLTAFELLNKATGQTIIVIHLDKGKKLIWRMRVALRLGYMTKQRVHLIGWQENKILFRIRNFAICRKVETICAIFGDGHIEVTGGFKKKHPWLYPVILREAEKLE
ncbi:MAG: hypothetical protein AM326_03080 [Candidatus Thorarchaeota archaeon SMTZ-45]|nr:MAG: hypothetical protein AM326_03080 [Candidatus Thorarchaeota archaeon SMTZ-45]